MKIRIRKAVLMAALVAVAVFLTGCKGSDYKKAAAMMGEGNYAEAQAAFEALGDYKDSAEKVLSCRYQLADGKLSGGDFEAALKEFTDLGDYGDSKEKIPACRYGIAEGILSEKKYEEALTAFTELKDYKDSAEKVLLCQYELAKEKLAAEDYEAAITAFAALSDYSDSKALLAEATDRLIAAKLPGTYESGNVDFTQALISGMASELADDGMDAEEVFQDVKLELNLLVTFTEDGKIIGSVDQEALSTRLDSIKESLTAALLDYFGKSLEAELSAQGISLEFMYALLGVDDLGDLFAAIAGTSVTDLFDASFEEAFSDLGMDDEGTYTVKDGKITAIDSTGMKEIYLMDLETGSLTLTEEGVPEEMAGMYPITFTRVK